MERDEPFFEISTDKVDTEIPSPVAGTLSEVLVQEGTTVAINAVVGRIGERRWPCGRRASGGPEDLSRSRLRRPNRPLQGAEPAPAARSPSRIRLGRTLPHSAGHARRRPLRPAKAETTKDHYRHWFARWRANTTSTLRRLREPAPEDESPSWMWRHTCLRRPRGPTALRPLRPPQPAAPVEHPQPLTAPAPAAPLPLAESAKVRTRAYEQYALKIAEHMVMSKRTSAHVTTVHRCDMTKIAKLRDRSKTEFQARNGFSLTFLPFVTAAAAEALRAFPLFNASIDGKNIVYYRTSISASPSRSRAASSSRLSATPTKRMWLACNVPLWIWRPAPVPAS